MIINKDGVLVIISKKQPEKQEVVSKDFDPTESIQSAIHQKMADAIKSFIPIPISIPVPSHESKVSKEDILPIVASAVKEEVSKIPKPQRGERGIQGKAGESIKGEKGDTGEGVPEGGDTGFVLTKLSPRDFDTGWKKPSPIQQEGAGSLRVVQSVTGLDTDTSDKYNPVVRISVDGVSITGSGTPADPLVSLGASGGVASLNSLTGVVTLSAGSNITLTPTGNDIEISATGGGGGGSGTVTTVSVATANGFAGTVANATTTPAITLTTSITGIIKGNGTAMSAAVAGTDYVAPSALASYVPYTGATGNVDLGANALITDKITSDSSGGLILENSSGGDVLHIGNGGGVNATAYGGWNFDGATADTIASFGASKTLSSLSTATYPSLAELSYVKGVTSAIQTQIDGKLTTSLTSARIFVGNGSNVATGVAMSGDATLANTGAITVSSASAGFTVSGGNLALGTNSITMTGSIATTGSRATKGWFTDLEITNAPTINGTSASGSGGLARATGATLVDAINSVSTPTTTSIGYLGAPQNLALDSADYTLVITDTGKSIDKTTNTARALTIPANGSVAFPIGTVIVGSNEGTGALTIGITTDTLRWGSSTGSRTVAQHGSWALRKLTSTVWRLTGDGIT